MRHYAKKGKTKIDPIFDQLNEINTTNDKSIDDKEIQRRDKKTGTDLNKR